MPDKLKILVVDDKRVIGDLFEYTLGYSGHKITLADSAQAAFRSIAEQKFDIAFLDIVMPEMDGVEAFKTIKTIAPSLPVIMMSGYSMEAKKKEARELGAVACLKKPFEMEEVKKIMQVALKKDIE